MNKIVKVFLVISPFILSDITFAQPYSFQGQLSGWLNYRNYGPDKTEVGFRYLPELRTAKKISDKKNLDLEIAINSYTSFPPDSLAEIEDNTGIKLYRLWLRYSVPQFETRLGLQKINFGPAKIMRSLMWFDQLDPQDPFKLTEGVTGLLLRYYFLNNTNLWFWGLPGNDKLKGLELVKTDKNRVEFGGRVQLPLPFYKSELAFSYHQRYLDTGDWNTKMSSALKKGQENRYALDGFSDIGIGIWFESVLGDTIVDDSQKEWRYFFTLGTDYTLRSGIHLLVEHFLHSSGEKIDKMNEIGKLSALSLDYKIGVLDSVNTIGYYDWKNEKTYAYLGWQRTYDNWQINLVGFSNREDSSDAFSGKGMQLTVTYNH